MASGANMEAPICLVENENEELRVNPEAVNILERITQPVVVVAIVGLYRTGKSYLMNRLAGQNHGFNLGTTVRSETKGIWMWCVPHPSKPKFTLVLLDTEGLGDVEKGDPKNDSWIFALAVLLSSTFVYNSMSTINHQALEQLHYVTELTELIRAKSTARSEEVDDSDEFVSFFPDFIWTVRDFVLELKLDGHVITADEYLENALKLIPGRSLKAQNSNMPRECIRHFFPRRKCFVFDRPTKEKELLVHVEEMPEDQLDHNFQVQSKVFCSYIFSNAKAKTLKEGIIVNGNRLATLVTTYMDAINSGAVPCLENAVMTLAQRENSIAVQKAADHYSEQMAQRVRLPTDTLQELLVVHAACEKEAIAVFMEHSFKDESQQFQKNLAVTIEEKKEDFLRQNEAASLSHCQAELDKLSESLRESISRGAFSVPGGHSLYLEARKKVERDYERVPRKGVKAKHVLQSFLQSQIPIEDSILQSDKALTDGQKAMEAERAQKEVAEKEQELLRQKQKELQQVMEAQERSYKENIAQLHQKMETERKNILREQEERLAHKLKVPVASDWTMEAPICLVQNWEEQLTVNLEAVRILEQIAQPLVVVAIVGLYRTGKSYLMNRLAGRNHGFSLGSRMQSKAKGIWMWCVPHPTKPTHTLVLLDTEGLGDVEKGDPKNDSWIFALAMLLSSTFVYNSMSTINHQALEQLHYVTELTKLIQAKSNPREDKVEDSSEFVSFFPDFIWTVRDFVLELKLDGQPITEDEYLENALKLIPGNNPKVQKSNMTRECIRYFFPVRKCFVFARPTSNKSLLFQIENVPENQLECSFQIELEKFCSYIFANGKTKTLRGGVIVTGNRLGTLVQTYVDAINSGTVSCLEKAVMTLAHHENSTALQKAAEHYSEQMAQRVRLPTDTLQELLDVHAACEKEAIAVFMEHSFKDENQQFQKRLVATIEERKEEFMRQNEAASIHHCQAELEKLSESLRKSISCGAFSVPGGHSLYLEARKKVELGYEQVPRKGVKAKEVLKSFLQSQATMEDAILQSDKALRDGEWAVAAERRKREVAEKTQELLRQRQKEQEQVMEAQERKFQEHIAKLQETLKTEREMMLRKLKML
ncbi:guanylate-binding protein 7-like isoform X2 [Apodemus sylvaticus]|uniref:guanylate-binding protein 7-like isoform X2 n=1 Tax=Apodemus sylvaticus TaxID=10129 RepID=UPI00224391FC|nr:guanylate-binding protein 7-like isoform X2 [Apodemus sylvaticus]